LLLQQTTALLTAYSPFLQSGERPLVATAESELQCVQLVIESAETARYNTIHYSFIYKAL